MHSFRSRLASGAVAVALAFGATALAAAPASAAATCYQTAAYDWPVLRARSQVVDDCSGSQVKAYFTVANVQSSYTAYGSLDITPFQGELYANSPSTPTNSSVTGSVTRVTYSTTPAPYTYFAKWTH